MRLDQVKHPTGEPDERECPDAAGDRGFVAFIDFLAGEAEKNGEGEQQRQPLGEFDRRHHSVYHAVAAKRDNTRIQAVNRLEQVEPPGLMPPKC
jgi:hypothetical protein